MASFSNMDMQRALSDAYRTSNTRVVGAISKLSAMIAVLVELSPKDQTELRTAAQLVVEEFSSEA